MSASGLDTHDARATHSNNTPVTTTAMPPVVVTGRVPAAEEVATAQKARKVTPK